MQDRAAVEVTDDRPELPALERRLIDAEDRHDDGRPPSQAPVAGPLHDAGGLAQRQTEPARALACRPAAPIPSTASRSNSAVNRPPGSAHGTRTGLTPGSGHWQRGTSAARIVWNRQVS